MVKKILILISLWNTFLFAEDVWDGEHYAQHSEPQYQWANSTIQKLHLNGSEHILDIGCGDGRITALLARAALNGQVLGIDVSDSMLNMAQKNEQLPNLKFLKKDATHLDYEPRFDLIVSFSCFHWVSNQLAAFIQIEKALKPSGKVFLYFGPEYGRDRLDHSIDKVIHTEQWNTYFVNYTNPFTLITPAKIATYAEEAHLLVNRMIIDSVDEIFHEKAAFKSWMIGWMPHLKQLPQDFHDQFLEEIIEDYLTKHPLDGEGKIHYIDYMIEVELYKET